MLNYIIQLLNRTSSDSRGASLVEYTLLVSLIALVCVGALSFIGDAIPTNINEARVTLES